MNWTGSEGEKGSGRGEGKKPLVRQKGENRHDIATVHGSREKDTSMEEGVFNWKRRGGLGRKKGKALRWKIGGRKKTNQKATATAKTGTGDEKVGEGRARPIKGETRSEPREFPLFLEEGGGEGTR